ncbi:MAG: ArnT family glycosyltransferase [Anaerolineae bacterium]
MNQPLKQHLRWILIVVLCCFLAQTAVMMEANSMTIDEGLHIASGYTIWRTGDYRLIEEHPPLVKLWLAWPLLPIPDLADPTGLPAWEDAAGATTESLPLLTMAQELLYPYRPINRWLFPARYMVALLGVLLLATVIRWARDATGPVGALVALVVAAFDPNLLAHSAVATTDVGAALLITLSLWQASRFLRSPSRRRALMTGVLLGAALSTKLTALLLGPALVLSGLLRLAVQRGKRRRRLLKSAVAIVTVAALALWGTYAFKVGNAPGIPFPVPAPAHAIPILRLQSHSRGGHQAYLLGENSSFGWWYYFPVAFILKTPVPALLLMATALPAAALAKWKEKLRGPRLTRLVTPSLLFCTVYLLASMLSPLNIGYRHLLPLLPLLYVGIGQGITVISQLRSPARTVSVTLLAALCGWQVTASLRYQPYLISYFNVLSGGPENGWRYLADSNTDWGQGYKALAEYQEEHDIEPVNLSAFIFYDPAIYGVDYRPLTPLGGDTPPIFGSRFAPPAGDYVISATPLDGIPTADPAMYDWFRWREPDAFIADALLHYRVTEAETRTAWVAQCVIPSAPLDEEAMAFGFGELPARRVPFDCTQAWIMPSLGAGPGAYVLHGALVDDPLRARLHLTTPPPVDPFVRRHLATSHLVYRQRMYRENPAFVIYRAAEERPMPAHTQVWIAPASVPVADVLQAAPSRAPVELDGALSLLGTSAAWREDALDVETWWQVTAPPDPEAPVSVMGHLLQPSGEAIEVADGLGIPIHLWEPGDVIVQRHTFAVDRGKLDDDLILRTGVYELANGRRWPVAGEGTADVLLVQLASR